MKLTKRLKRLFFIKEYAAGQTYCYHADWTIRIIRVFGFKLMWIKQVGYSIDVFPDIQQALEFKREKQKEYLDAKKYISK
jgi:hypothetical protein